MNKIIYALGFFDGVHIGHAALLKVCRELAGEHTCRAGAVTFGAHPDTLVQHRTPVLLHQLPTVLPVPDHVAIVPAVNVLKIPV